MDILLKLMLWLGPVAVAVCLISALRGTRRTDIPGDLIGLGESLRKMNQPDRRYNVR